MAYTHVDLFPLGPDETPYRHLGSEGVSVERIGDREVLNVSREAIRRLSEQAFIDISPTAHREAETAKAHRG